MGEEYTTSGEKKEIKIRIEATDPRLDPSSPDFDFDEWKNSISEFSARIDGLKKRLLNIINDNVSDSITIQQQAKAALMDTLTALTERSIKINSDALTALINSFIGAIDEQTQRQNEGQMSLFPEDEEQQRLKNEVLSALPRLQSLIPQKHLIPNNKLANSLTQDIIDAGLIELDVSGKREPELITRCILNYEGDNVKLSSRQPFTEYDRNVADAVTSLYEYGDASHIITAAQVFRAMVHATETETPSAQQIGAVTKSLDKMRFVRVQIDCSEELTRRKIDLNGAQITNGKIDTYLLALDKLEVTAGGQKVTAYKVIKSPILYDYSRLTGQVITLPAALLDIRDGNGAKVANTDRRIAIKGYLMRRISVMNGKNGSRQSKHILYDRIYGEVSDGKNLNRRDQQLIREYIALVLDSWKREGFIKGYAELTQGRKKTGVEIKT